MKKIIFVAALFSATYSAAVCIPARESVKIPPTAGDGMYHRFHPSGNSAIFSYDGYTSILDLKEKNVTGAATAKVIPTVMKKEAYACEGSWSLVASPFDEGMSFYEYARFFEKDANPKKVKPVFRDKDINELYHSCAELDGSTERVKKIRMMVWSNRRTKEYQVNYDKNGSFEKAEEVKNFNACNNLVGMTPDRQKKLDEISVTRSKYADIYYKAKREKTKQGELKAAKIAPLWQKAENEYKALEPIDTQLMNPVLSKDGRYVSALVGEEIKIFQINADNSCNFIAGTGFRGSKATFSYPEAGKLPQIVFSVDGDATNEYKNSAVVFDPNTKTSKVVSLPGERPYYPGFTLDGRVQYRSKNEIVTVDPNQTSQEKSACIDPERTRAQRPGKATGTR